MTRAGPRSGAAPVVAAALAAVALTPGAAAGQVSFESFDRSLDCSVDPCAAVLPGAVRFAPVADKPWAEGRSGGGDLVGHVVLSTDVVDIKGYSGKPMVTLIGLDLEGRIAGARVVHHSEPILLVGIPEGELHAFVDAYTGMRADQRVLVGGTAPGTASVDIISGATVTILAENRTILDTARALGEGVGAIEPSVLVPGHFVEDPEPWTWAQMVDRGALGHLRVTHAEMGVDQGAADDAWVEIWFGVADGPGVGKALLGERVWQRARDRLEPGEHLVVMVGGGTSSFKGSGFVRGGIFDRVRLEQGLRSTVFRDLDYTNIGQVPAAGAPRLEEGALFVARGGRLDPGVPFDLVFLGSSFTLQGGIDRDFKTFRATHRTPRSVYVLDGPSPEALMVRQAWQRQARATTFVVAWLLLVAGIFAGRRWTAATLPRIQRLHAAFLVVAFVVLGLGLSLQPSITQLLTLVGAVVWEWRWGLFLSDPLLFVSWIFIAAMTLAWGRGVFCGWVCPYGAMNELLYKLGGKLKLPRYELPDAVHLKARYIRYGVLAILVTAFLVSPPLGERMAEVEPFKSTFFVAPWERPAGLFAWWLLLAGAAVVWFRPFCRYVCPLGAALALPSSFRLSSPMRRDFCSKGCRICPRGCEPKAIRKDGSIDPRECLNCWECEATYHDDQRCPPLVQIRRRAEKAARLPRRSA